MCLLHINTSQDRGTKIPLDYTDIASMLLSPEKVKEREDLIAQGFPGWNRSHYYSFLDGMAIYGRDRLELVAPMVREKRVTRKAGEERRGEESLFGTVRSDCSALILLLLCFPATRYPTLKAVEVV